MNIREFRNLFGATKPIIGMVHLPPLPGAPLHKGESIYEITAQAVKEAKLLEENGCTGIMMENFGDVPFWKKVDPETVAYMTSIGKAIRDNITVPMGICVLQSDGRAGIGIAHAVSAQWVRIPYYTEVYVVDTGLMESIAAEVTRIRKVLGAEDVAIFADVHIKHGYPLAQRPIELAAIDAVERCLADAVVVTGIATGAKTSLDDVKRVKQALDDVPVLAGSGVGEDDIMDLLQWADGVIVGTSIKQGGITRNPVDPRKVEKLCTTVYQRWPRQVTASV